MLHRPCLDFSNIFQEYPRKVSTWKSVFSHNVSDDVLFYFNSECSETVRMVVGGSVHTFRVATVNSLQNVLFPLLLPKMCHLIITKSCKIKFDSCHNKSATPPFTFCFPPAHHIKVKVISISKESKEMFNWLNLTNHLPCGGSWPIIAMFSATSSKNLAAIFISNQNL